jgi:hypothetical protein
MSLNVRVTNPVVHRPAPPAPPGRPAAPRARRARLTRILVPLIALLFVAAAVAVTAWFSGRGGGSDGALVRIGSVALPASGAARVVSFPVAPPAAGIRLEATMRATPQDLGFVGLGCWTERGVGYVFAVRGDGSAGVLRLGSTPGRPVALTVLRPTAAFVPGARELGLECAGGDAVEPTVIEGFVDGVAVIALGVDPAARPFSSVGIWRSASTRSMEVRSLVLTRHRPDSGPPPFLVSPVVPPPTWAGQPAGAGVSGSTD